MMFHYLSYLLCMVTVISNLHANPFKERESAEVDDLIDKVITSEKFNKLADKIAERAAEKLLQLQHSSHNEDTEKKDDSAHYDRIESHDRHHNNNEEKSTEKEHKEREENKESKEKDRKESVETENEKHKKNHNGKAKINTNAAIEKFADFPGDQLSLNYKHFTAREGKQQFSTVSNKKHRASVNDEVYKRVHEDSSETEATVTTTKSVKEGSDSLSVENKKAKLSVSESDNSGSDDDVTESTTTTTTTTTAKESEEHVTQINDEESTTKHHKKKGKKKHKKTKKHSEEATTESVTRTSEPNSSEENKKSEELTKKTEEETSDDNKVSIADIEEHKEENKQEKTKEEKTKDLIREENGKLYAFQQSPDYADYHEKLSKVIKTVQNKEDGKI